MDPCVDKPNNITYSRPSMDAEYAPPDNMIELAERYDAKQELNHRWTTQEMNFGRGANVKRVFDLLPKAKMSISDYRPLPSSFNVGGVYR